MNDQPLLVVRDLSISYQASGQATQAVKHLAFSLAQGETVAIVGESGSGKSTLANALLGLLPGTARIDSGQLWVDGLDVVRASERQKRQLRGRTVGLVPQDPMVSLNPTLRIGQQIGEALVLAQGGRSRSVDADVLELLAQVGLDNPAVRARQYPHELSGGMRQRVLIAIALAGNPRLIIADEPTSALDVTVQRKILDHLQRLVAERGISLLIITHDLGMATDRADRLLVMKQGELVEQGPPAQIVQAPQHPYTRALLNAAPAFSARRQPRQLAPGSKPILSLQGVGKTFELPKVKGQDKSFVALQGLTCRFTRGKRWPSSVNPVRARAPPCALPWAWKRPAKATCCSTSRMSRATAGASSAPCADACNWCSKTPSLPSTRVSRCSTASSSRWCRLACSKVRPWSNARVN